MRTILFLSGLTLLASLFQLLSGLMKVLQSGLLIDFSAFYSNTQLFLSGGNPYAPHSPFNYPPALLLMLSPMTVFPQSSSQIIFTIVSLFALIASCLMFFKLFNKSWSLFFIVTAIIIQTFPVKFTLSMGQVNLLVLLFVTLAFIFDAKKRQVFAAVFWTLSMVLKITPVTLVLYLLVKRRFKTLIWGATLFILSNFLLVYFRGWTSSYFLTAVPSFFLKIDNSLSVYDQSLRALFSRLGFGQQAGLLSGIIVLIMYICAIIAYQRGIYAKNKVSGRLNDLRFFSLILAITTIGNSYAWQHHFVLLILGYIAEVIYQFNLIKKSSLLSSPLQLGEGKVEVFTRGFLLLTSFLLFSFHFSDPLLPPNTNPFLISHTLIGALILIGLLFVTKARLD